VAKILIVDDDIAIRRAVRELLREVGHEVVEAADGTEALPLLETTAFALVITDVYMAEMDGMELFRRIRLKDIRVPVVVISGGGHARPERVLQVAAACGAVATLTKPFTPQQLLEAVEPLLSRSEPP